MRFATLEPNIIIVGNQVKVKDRKAVDLATATNAYKGLVEVIESKTTTVNYYGLKPGETSKLRESVTEATGQTVSEVSYDYVIQRSGWGAYYLYSDGTKVFDVYVPAADTSTVEGMNGGRFPFLRRLSSITKLQATPEETSNLL